MPSRFPRYERLLGLYPKAYRERYGRQMLQTLADMLDDAQTRRQRLLVWMKVAADLPASVTKTQLQYSGGVMHDETPAYIKRTGLLTAGLLLPFFLALAANGLDKVINNHTLFNSWLWHMPALGIWVLWLPATALVLNLAGYAAHTFRPERQAAAPWRRRALDIRHVWPVVLPGLAAAGILFILAFHDSAHCWVQNPAYFVTRFHQTLQCTRSGFLGG